MVGDDQKRQVQQATDIVRLIGEQVSLKPKGKEFLGICPFHDDKNPSMHVSPAKQIYKCFSCGAGGDVFTFVMNYHKMNFPEALKHLAERAGIKLAEWKGSRGRGAEGSSEEEGQTDRQRIAAANAQAVEFYRALLRHSEHGPLAREYVAKRGISPEMVEAFQLGYAPDRWDGLVRMIESKGWDQRAFEMAGLISPRGSRVAGHESRVEDQTPGPDTRDPRPETHSFYDRLRHRLIFPIFDAIGRPIAFGGRKLRDEDEPKYLNSPETALFNKSATLYGLHLAKKPIIDSKTAIIVEGYTDVIACHQAGVRNVVATLGTALTPQHLAELRRYCEKVVLIYDADEAGIKAADRAVEVFLEGEVDVYVAEIPPRHNSDGTFIKLDPDELLALPDGTARWNHMIDTAKDAISYMLDRVRVNYSSTETISGRQRMIDGFIETLVRLGLHKQTPSRRGLIIQRMAIIFRMNWRKLEVRVSDAIRKQKHGTGFRMNRQPAVEQSVTEDPRSPFDVFISRAAKLAHRNVIGCIVKQPELFHRYGVDEALVPTEVTGDERSLYEIICHKIEKGEGLGLARLLADLAELGLQSLASLLTTADAVVDEVCENTTYGIEAVLRSNLDFLRYIRDRKEYLEDKSRTLHRFEIGEVGDDEVDSFLRRMCEFFRTHSYHPYSIYRGADATPEKTTGTSGSPFAQADAVAGRALSA